mmetsp:Transcript_131300/g.365996  ORF Transcript_131300/g.365996 Transcript_131300/m.365996 type:complete len:148 (+) Transcript_131300:74-517(+)
MFASCNPGQSHLDLDYGAFPSQCGSKIRSDSPDHEMPRPKACLFWEDDVSDGVDSEPETLASRDARAREAAAALLNVQFLQTKKKLQPERSYCKKQGYMMEQPKTRYSTCSVDSMLDLCDVHKPGDAENPLVRQDNSDDEGRDRFCM